MKPFLCACITALVASGIWPSPARAQHAPPSSAPGAGTRERDTAVPDRDPFVRPTAEASDEPVQEHASVPRADGLQGLSREEISVRGVLQASGRSVALVQGPDRKQYVVRAGDRLRDAQVEAVVRGGLVVVPDEAGAAVNGARRVVIPSLNARSEGQ